VKGKDWQWAVGLVAAAIGGGLVVTWLLSPTPISSRLVEVPALRGVASAQAIATLAEAGLRGRLSGELEDPLAPEGTISWQSPVAGTALPESAVVRLGVSSGAPRILMPDVVDLDLVTAVRVLTTAGLRIGPVDSIHTALPPGVVVRSRPDARQPVRAGSGVEITVSKGPRSSQ
jgi:beta-lactam-binding protein with PASTA domain